MARGDTFEILLTDVDVEWQNLYVSATVYNREDTEHLSVSIGLSSLPDDMDGSCRCYLPAAIVRERHACEASREVLPSGEAMGGL